MKAPKKPKAIWEAKVPVEKENTVPEVNIFAVTEEVPEVHFSVAEAAAYKGTEKPSSVQVTTSVRMSLSLLPAATAEIPPGQLSCFLQSQLPR